MLTLFVQTSFFSFPSSEADPVLFVHIYIYIIYYIIYIPKLVRIRDCGFGSGKGARSLRFRGRKKRVKGGIEEVREREYRGSFIR